MQAAATLREDESFARPLAALLETLAGEVEAVRTLGERVESSICAAQRHVELQGKHVEDLQQIDLMLQQLSALRDFLTAISAVGASDSHVQIAAGLARVTLAEMKARLSGEQGGGVATGDLEMW